MRHWPTTEDPTRPAPKRLPSVAYEGLVVGRGVVDVVVVVAGEAAAWAGTITDLTTGLTQRSGKTSGLNEPPPNAICKMRRRSTVMVEDPPLGAFGAPTPEHSQNIRLHGSAQAITIRPAGIEGQCEDQHSAGGAGITLCAPVPCPNTAAGKSIASRNALRHRLAALVHKHPALFAEIEGFAEALCNGENDRTLFAQALTIGRNELVPRTISAQQIGVIERLTDPSAIARQRRYQPQVFDAPGIGSCQTVLRRL